MSVRVNKASFSIREKLSELERPIGLKGSELMRAETAQEARDLVSAGRKNLIINGDFKVSQRGSYTSSTSMSHNTYYLDRWFADHGNTVTATFRQITTDLPKQYRNETNTGLRFEATSSNSSAYLGFRQKYEFMSHLDGKFVTVSAWVKSNKRAVIINYDGTPPYNYAQHSGSGQWEYLSYTTFISNPSSNHFDVFLIEPTSYSYTNISSGDYVEVTNYQVEIGKNATEFEHRSYGEELALCQRYCYVIRGDWPAATAGEVLVGNGVWNGSNNAYIKIQHPVTMLKVPSIDYGNLGWYRVVAEAVSWRGISSLSLLTDSCSINSTTISVTATSDTRGLVARMTTQTTSAKLILSSEL